VQRWAATFENPGDEGRTGGTPSQMVGDQAAGVCWVEGKAAYSRFGRETPPVGMFGPVRLVLFESGRVQSVDNRRRWPEGF